MNQYKCLNNQVFQCGDYTITPIRREDIFLIKGWRNEQITILRQKKIITDEEQLNYYENIIKPTFNESNPEQILFSILLNGTCIGYGGLVHIDWESTSAEISFLTETQRNEDKNTFKKDFYNYLSMLKRVSFEELKLNKITTRAYNIRPYLIDVLEEHYFTQEGVLKEEILIDDNLQDLVIHSFFRKDYASKTIINKNILITSISSKIPFLTAVQKAASKLGKHIKVYGSDMNPKCLGAYILRKLFWEMPNTSMLDLSTIVSYCKTHDINIIIPTRDGELLFWAKNKEELDEAGIKVIISESKAVEVCLDKLLFYSSELTTGYPVIPTSTNIDDHKDCKSFVVKERFGAGAKSIGIKLSKADTLEHARKLENPIFQPYVDGIEISIDIYICLSGKVKGSICRTRDEVVSGESQVTTVFQDSKLTDLCNSFVETLGLYGPAVLQVIKDNVGQYHIIECNSRFGGASTLGIAAGLDTFYWAILEANDIDIAKYTFQPFKQQMRQIRYKIDEIQVW